jgi:hypothetical protein
MSEQFVQRDTSDVSTVLISQLEDLNREVMKSVLTYGEMSMSESQFRAFRKVVLDLYGGNGIQRKVRELVARILVRGSDRAGVLRKGGQTDGKGVVTMT